MLPAFVLPLTRFSHILRHADEIGSFSFKPKAEQGARANAHRLSFFGHDTYARNPVLALGERGSSLTFGRIIIPYPDQFCNDVTVRCPYCFRLYRRCRCLLVSPISDD